MQSYSQKQRKVKKISEIIMLVRNIIVNEYFECIKSFEKYFIGLKQLYFI